MSAPGSRAPVGQRRSGSTDGFAGMGVGASAPLPAGRATRCATECITSEVPRIIFPWHHRDGACPASPGLGKMRFETARGTSQWP